MSHTVPVAPEPSLSVPRIRGALGEKVLRKSPELFNQSLPTVLAEVLQNSRRAGATRMEIELLGGEGHATLVVRDDGHGIADMAQLVTFGSSDWDERTDLMENAAGMGVFSLASRGVTVRSRGRRVTLSREVFCGEAEAAVLPDPGMGVGTELLFPVNERAVPQVIERVCRFYPLPVTLNGQALPRRDFLAGAVHEVAWQGLRLGVFHAVPPAVRGVHDAHWGSERHLYLNFHGHVVRCEGAVTLAEVDGRRWCVLADVVNAPDLRLVLPARHEPIENDFFRALRQRMERAILEAVAASGRHALAYADSRRAAALGIVLPEPAITLPAWRMGSEESRGRLDEMPPVLLGRESGEVLLVPGPTYLERFEEANLHAFLAAWPGHPTVVEGLDAYIGYPAYDALPRVVRLEAEVTGIDGTQETWPSVPTVPAQGQPAPVEADHRLVRGIRARLLLRHSADGQAAASVMRHAVALPFLFVSETDTFDFPGTLVAEGTGPADLADALVDGFFVHSDDAGADSYERQLEGYRADAIDLARRLLLTADQAAVARVMDVLRDAGWTLRTLRGGRIEIDIPAEGDGTIAITDAAGTLSRHAL
ncbi:ATP-binding protein (plasmid) [Roseomonas sp. OT10]|uniref:ATP-binding protein n=1 Tax=Roseomonas cutis TaxID=2897332 RepID=UPI001E35D3CB|nr:ATP-binding protein [Roseomonas sp. OT10]UFN51675.1 ATP-binding protein [Roseomonas sp. OT10]